MNEHFSKNVNFYFFKKVFTKFIFLKNVFLQFLPFFFSFIILKKIKKNKKSSLFSFNKLFFKTKILNKKLLFSVFCSLFNFRKINMNLLLFLFKQKQKKRNRKIK